MRNERKWETFATWFNTSRLASTAKRFIPKKRKSEAKWHEVKQSISFPLKAGYFRLRCSIHTKLYKLIWIETRSQFLNANKLTSFLLCFFLCFEFCISLVRKWRRMRARKRVVSRWWIACVSVVFRRERTRKSVFCGNHTHSHIHFYYMRLMRCSCQVSRTHLNAH